MLVGWGVSVGGWGGGECWWDGCVCVGGVG